MSKVLIRTVFTTSRMLDYFAEKDLTSEIGWPRWLWPFGLAKELVDNSLDACETSGTSPVIALHLTPPTTMVTDNGPGLPLDVLRRSLDYSVRVSDKVSYIAPTRGQQGIGLKAVWAAPYAFGGRHGRVDVTTESKTYRIDIESDRISQVPNLVLTEETGREPFVKSGTSIRIQWYPTASCPDGLNRAFSTELFSSLVHDYAAFNPHARFTLTTANDQVNISPTNTGWRKWTPSDPTSPHWYTLDQFTGLVASYLAAERQSGRELTVREFAGSFAGLTGSSKQRSVLAKAGLAGAHLHDLVDGRSVNASMAEGLLSAMCAESRVIQPIRLGVIGEAHLRQHLEKCRYCDPATVRYTRQSGLAEGMPYVLEVSFGQVDPQYEQFSSRASLFGLNWSPTYANPNDKLADVMAKASIAEDDPVVLIVHLACPRLEFTDRAKTRLQLSPEVESKMEDAIRTVTQRWTAHKKQLERHRAKSARQTLGGQKSTGSPSLKVAAYQVMPSAYVQASAQGTLPANARQIMYAARPEILRLTGGKIWQDSAYFTQHLLPDYIDDNPESVANWDVVYDDRGHFREPHTGLQFGLGTLPVRSYTAAWDTAPQSPQEPFNLSWRMSTVGPKNRYRFALFVEKEGFQPLLERANIAERYDLAIMSTKGMSVTAARQLVEHLSDHGVTILVLHDFDKSGFSILHTLQHDTRRYQFKSAPKVVDLGLRLDDVRKLSLQTETVTFPGQKDPRENLRASGANMAECNFLVRGQRGRQWYGERVELNAMASDGFLQWLEARLKAVGADAKMVPPKEVLISAFREARRWALLQAELKTASARVQKVAVKAPINLEKKIKQMLQADRGLAWDQAMRIIAEDDSP